MFRIAFNLRWPPQMTLDKHPGGDARDAHRSGVKQRFAGNHLLRLAHIGDNYFLWLPGAGRSPDEQDRCSHDTQEAAAGLRVVPVRRAIGELIFDEGAKVVSSSKFFQAAPIN